MINQITTIDATVIAGTFLTLILLGIHGARKSAISSELLVMGRQLSFPLFVSSLVSSWYGGILGVTALTFQKGIFNFLTQGIFWYLAYLVFAFFVVDKVADTKAQTFAELIGQKVGPRARRVSAVLHLLCQLPFACMLNFALLCQIFWGLSLPSSAFLALLIIAMYSIGGGFRSLVYADAIQFITMIAAVFSVTVFSILKWGLPHNIFKLLPPSHLNPTGGESFSTIIIWGFIAFSTLADPLFYQRTLACPDKKTAKRAVLCATAVWFLFDCCTTLGGLYAKAIFPQANAHESYVKLAFSVLPQGFRGLFVSGLLCASLSSLDSGLFTSATALAYDFQGKRSISRAPLLIHFLMLGLLTLIIVNILPHDIAEIWKLSGSLLGTCLLVPWMIALLRRPSCRKSPYSHRYEVQYVASILIGLIAFLLGAVLNGRGDSTVDPFYFGLAGSLLGHWISRIFVA